MRTNPIGVLRATAAALVLGLAMTAPAVAQKDAAKADDAHRKEDIAKHRAISVAHENAARCLEQGQKESTCHEALRKACQGLAVGRYCGMKHSH